MFIGTKILKLNFKKSARFKSFSLKITSNCILHIFNIFCVCISYYFLTFVQVIFLHIFIFGCTNFRIYFFYLIKTYYLLNRYGIARINDVYTFTFASQQFKNFRLSIFFRLI